LRDLTERALLVARKLGASYADIRVVSTKQEGIRTKNGNVDSLSSSRSRGFGIRVLYDGAWGFSSSSIVTPEEVEKVAGEAVAIAKASATVKRDKDVKLAPVEPVVGRWESEYEIDPFSVKTEDKIKLLLEADKLMRANKGVRVAGGSIACLREEKVFASTEGSYIEQVKTETGAGIDATAVDKGELQRRSYPGSFGGDWASRGYEIVEEMHLLDHS